MAFVQGSVTVSHDDETIEDSFFELLQPGTLKRRGRGKTSFVLRYLAWLLHTYSCSVL